MEQDEFEKRLADATARGIAREKTRESAAVFKVIGAGVLAWIVGAASGYPLAGMAVLVTLLAMIWRGYEK